MKATLILAALFAPAAARTLVQPSLARLRGGAIMTPKESYHSYAGKGKVVAEMAPEKSFAASAHAGLIVGFGALLAVGVASGISGLDAKASRIAFGFTFPYILFVILQAGGQLYTGNVGSVMSAYFEGLVPASSILRPLAVSFAGNMVGAVGFAFVAKHLALITPHVGALAAKSAPRAGSNRGPRARAPTRRPPARRAPRRSRLPVAQWPRRGSRRRSASSSAAPSCATGSSASRSSSRAPPTTRWASSSRATSPSPPSSSSGSSTR